MTVMQKMAAEDQGVKPDRLVDLVPFYLGFAAYAKWLEQTGGRKDGVFDRGELFARRYSETLEQGMEQFFQPLTERSDAVRLQSEYRRADRSGSPAEKAIFKADFLQTLFGWFRAHPEVFRNIFSGKSRKAGTSVMQLASEDSPIAIVAGAAGIASVSGLQGPHKWLSEAAARMGVGLNAAEEQMVMVESVANLASAVQQVNGQIAGAPPNSEKAATLAAQKADLLAQMVESAEGDTGVLQAAAAAAFKPHSGHQTATGAKLSLNADQEAAMMASGKKVVAAGAGSGKCVVGDTLVQTQGGFIPIAELAQNLEAEQDAPFETMIHGVNGPEPTSHVYYDGVRQTRKIVTHLGYELEGTSLHKVLTLREGTIQWVTLGDLAEGDHVCLDRRPGLFAEVPFKRIPEDPNSFKTIASPKTNVPLELTPQVASLLGWIVSEGYVRPHQWNISLATVDPEQRDLYQKAFDGLIVPTWREDNRNRKQFVADFHRAADIRALIGFGLTRTLAGEKSVPVGILRSPKPVVAAFLQALFDGDGGVSGPTVEYSSASETLAKQVHILLMAFGIPCRRSFKPNKGQGAWRLIIGGIGLRVFVKEIGFGLKSKMEALWEIAQKPCNTNIDLIPGISHLCRAVQGKYAEVHGTTKTAEYGYDTFKCMIAGTRRPSFDSLKAFLNFYQIACPEWDRLNALCASGWFLDSVDEIVEGVAQVYDFVVPGTHSFSAGAFVNHNTRVLAGEVAYRINEQGYDATSICAVSFTQKSSKELVHRAQKYGAVIDGAAADGFGTTHYIAGVTILSRLAKGGTKRPKYFGKSQNWAPTTLVTLAVRQVGMKGNGAPAPQPKNLFTDQPVEIPEDVRMLDVPNFDVEEDDPRKQELLGLIQDGIQLFTTGWPARFQGGSWAQWASDFLRSMKSRIEAGSIDDLTPNMKNQLNKLMTHIQKQYGRSMRVAGADDNAAADVSSGDSSGVKRKGNTKYIYWEQPARQWFNLGVKWEGAGDKSGKEGQQFSAAGVKRKIDIWKGMGVTPEEVWYAAGAAEGKVLPFTPEAAAYAAYEWLKGRNGEPDFRNTGDMNDLLIDAARTLALDKKARQAVQSRFKVILVDEAQDLNRCQHILFSLMAGAIDENLLPTEHMTADTFGFIGDDKQAIYEFRGAEPDEFIDKSDLVPGGQDYETHLLDTNYRSGQAIVEAANQLIKHNAKQIPMTCKANYEVKGDGHIKARSFASPTDAADMVAETIADFAEANATANAKYSNYGIAVRSNAEAMHYALGMVKRAIPFKSKVNPFKSPPVKAMLGWMSLVEGGPKMSRGAFLAAVKDAVRMPASYLGDAFHSKLEDQQEPLKWLSTMDPFQEFAGNYAKNVAALVDNIAMCFGMHGSPDTPENVYDTLLTSLKSSDGKSFFDGIVDNIKDNNDKMAELAAENTEGIPSDEQIDEAAEEELVLLTGLMGAKTTVDGVMDYVRELKVVNEKVAAGDDDDKDAVVISTMHGWKGLEVPKLFLPMVRGKFPRVKLVKNPISGEMECQKPDENDPALASERRLAYVAITRAEDTCIMMDIMNPSQAFQDCPESQFISEACVQMEDDGKEDDFGSEIEDDVGEGKTANDLLSIWDEEVEVEGAMWDEPTEEDEQEARLLLEAARKRMNYMPPRIDLFPEQSPTTEQLLADMAAAFSEETGE